MRSNPRVPARPRGAVFFVVALFCGSLLAGLAYPVSGQPVWFTEAVSGFGLQETRDRLLAGTAQARADARRDLEARFLDEASGLTGLTWPQAKAVQRLYGLAVLGQPQPDRLLRAWSRENPGTVASGALADQVWLLSEFESREGNDTDARQLVTQIIGALDGPAAQAVDTRTWAAAARALGPHLSDGERATLLNTARAAFANEIESKTSFGLRDAEEYLGVRMWQDVFVALSDAEASGHLAYARLLPAFLDRMTQTEIYWRFNYGYMELLAEPLAREEGRTEFRRYLTDDDGRLRQGVARILAYAYRGAGELDRWKTECDQQIQEARDEGANDRAAQWLMALGYAQAIAPEPLTPQREFGRVQRALRMSDNPQTWSEALGRMVFIHCAYHRHDDARRDLDRYGPRLTDTAQVTRLEQFIRDSEYLIDQEAIAEF